MGKNSNLSSYGFNEQPQFDGFINSLKEKADTTEIAEQIKKQESDIKNINDINTKQDEQILGLNVDIKQSGNAFTFTQGGKNLAVINQENGEGSSVIGGSFSNGKLTLNNSNNTSVEIDASSLAFKGDATSIPNLDAYATKQWVEDKKYLTQHQSLDDYAKTSEVSGELAKKSNVGHTHQISDITDLQTQLNDYATEQWVENKGYLTSHQSLDDYAKKTEIPSLEGYATEQWVNSKNYLTSHQSLEDYATKEQLSTKADKKHTHLLKDITDYVAPNLSIYAKKTDIPSLNGYATEEWVTNKGYLTSHQSLEDYYTKTQVDAKLKGISGGTVDLSDYYTKVESDDKYALKTSIPTLDGYATEEWVNSKGFLTTHQDLSTYAKKTELANYYTKAESDGKYALSADIPSLNGYATEQWVTNQGYLTTHQSLEDYATKEQLSTKADKEHTHLLKDITDYVAPNLSIYAKKTDIPSLNGYATEQWVTDKGYLTSHQDLTDYAKKTDIPNMDGYATKTELSTKQDKGDYALKSDIKPIPSVLSAFQNDVGYLTTHQDLTSYAKKTDIPSLEGYATEQWVTSKGYLTSHQDISGKQDVLVSGTNIKTVNGATLLGSGNIQIEIGEQALASYAKTADADAKLDKKANVQHTHEISDVTNLQTKLNGYALKTEIQEVPKFKTVNGQAITGSTDNIEITTDLSNYYKKTETSGATEIRDALANKQDYNANYVTSDQLAGYATTSYVNNELAQKANATDIPTNTIELTFTLTDGSQITKTFYIQL